jgi:hypothetical protein
VSTFEIPLTFAAAGLVGLGGLAFLMGAVLSLVAELLAVLRGHRNWVRSDGKTPGRAAVRPGLRQPHSGDLVTTVLAWQNRSDVEAQRSDGELRGPRAAA